MRSRMRSLPRSRWRWTYFGPPPPRAASSSTSSSSSRAVIAAPFAAAALPAASNVLVSDAISPRRQAGSACAIPAGARPSRPRASSTVAGRRPMSSVICRAFATRSPFDRAIVPSGR